MSRLRDLGPLCINFLVLPQIVRGLTSLGSVWGLVGNMGEWSYYAPVNVDFVWGNGEIVDKRLRSFWKDELVS